MSRVPIAASRHLDPNPGIKEFRVFPTPGKTWVEFGAGIQDELTLALFAELNAGSLEAWQGEDGQIRFYRPRQSEKKPQSFGLPSSRQLLTM
jgi:hypothetical protein